MIRLDGSAIAVRNAFLAEADHRMRTVHVRAPIPNPSHAPRVRVYTRNNVERPAARVATRIESVDRARMALLATRGMAQTRNMAAKFLKPNVALGGPFDGNERGERTQ
jgi:hypothetical protein